MPQTPHLEKHFTASAMIRDIVIGMSDGLTVPFALAAGLSGAVSSTGIIVTAGLAEVAAGSIAMGLGGYLASKSDAEHYDGERKREHDEVGQSAELEVQEMTDIFQTYGVTATESAPVVAALRKNPEAWVDFMMRFELGLDKPEPGRALTSALTIAFSYMVGGLIPLTPYFLIAKPIQALMTSASITLVALLIFGYIKGKFTSTPPLQSALQTAIVGSLAAAAAFAIARAIS
jgi:vacuolar iron transporter family protein